MPEPVALSLLVPARARVLVVGTTAKDTLTELSEVTNAVTVVASIDAADGTDYDVVAVLGNVHEIAELPAVLRAASSHLRPGGRLLVRAAADDIAAADLAVVVDAGAVTVAARRDHGEAPRPYELAAQEIARLRSELAERDEALRRAQCDLDALERALAMREATVVHATAGAELEREAGRVAAALADERLAELNALRQRAEVLATELELLRATPVKRVARRAAIAARRVARRAVRGARSVEGGEHDGGRAGR